MANTEGIENPMENLGAVIEEYVIVIKKTRNRMNE